MRVGLAPLAALLAFFVISYMMGYYMLNPILRTLRSEGLLIGATEAEWRFYAGLIATLLQGVGLAVTPFTGILADKFGRRPVILALSLVMGAGLLLVSTAGDYWSLLSFFVLYGAGYVGMGPAMYAFISDIVPSERRALGYAVYYSSSVMAMILGIVIAGALLGWRSAYAAAGLATLVFGALLVVFSKGRGAPATGVSTRYSLRGALPSLSNPIVAAIILMITPWTIPWGALSVFSIDYISTKWGLPTATASLVIALATLSIAVGHIAGGLLSDRLASREGLVGRVKVSILGVALGYLAMSSMILYPYPYGDTSLRALLLPALLALAGMMFTTFTYPNINTVLSEVVAPEYRGTVFAVYNVLNNLGWTLGPLFYTSLLLTLSQLTDLLTAMTMAAFTTVSLWLLALAVWLYVRKTLLRRAATA